VLTPLVITSVVWLDDGFTVNWVATGATPGQEVILIYRLFSGGPSFPRVVTPRADGTVTVSGIAQGAELLVQVAPTEGDVIGSWEIIRVVTEQTPQFVKNRVFLSIPSTIFVEWDRPMFSDAGAEVSITVSVAGDVAPATAIVFSDRLMSISLAHAVTTYDAVEWTYVVVNSKLIYDANGNEPNGDAHAVEVVNDLYNYGQMITSDGDIFLTSDGDNFKVRV